MNVRHESSSEDSRLQSSGDASDQPKDCSVLQWSRLRQSSAALLARYGCSADVASNLRADIRLMNASGLVDMISDQTQSPYHQAIESVSELGRLIR